MRTAPRVNHDRWSETLVARIRELERERESLRKKLRRREAANKDLRIRLKATEAALRRAEIAAKHAAVPVMPLSTRYPRTRPVRYTR